MTEKRKVLITGISGSIGRLMREHLAADYELSGIDQKPVEDVPALQTDISELDTIVSAFEGIDTVVHLAANPSPRASWESVLQDNIIGTRNVFEAARRAGVRRIVFASSHHASSYHVFKEDPYKSVFDGRVKELPDSFEPLTTDVCRPTSLYGVSKVFGESLGRYYHDHYGISVICLRIGWVMRPDDPTFSAPSVSLWLSHRDAAQIIRKSIEASDSVGYAVVNAESGNRLGVYDQQGGKTLLGYVPEDDAGSQWTETENSPPVI
ncbi:MAG: NAD(P)-dependent oxidoreductase [Proteobacteria bacterium]|jgi:NAD+ dependent glucose-6-phosphate dehydrogenase|nr:NAD(P)-dependent oxidoreductase [Pseudomonadota bacterium]MDA1298972.1 NAD(P)-dependent oxidoreductase [Pseudomonadota bacterium]